MPAPVLSAMDAILTSFATEDIIAALEERPLLPGAGEGDPETATSWTVFQETPLSTRGSGICVFRKNSVITDPSVIAQLRIAGANIKPNRS